MKLEIKVLLDLLFLISRYSILRCIARGLYKDKSDFFEKFNDAGYTCGADYT